MIEYHHVHAKLRFYRIYVFCSSPFAPPQVLGRRGPSPPAHHPECTQYLFSTVATSTARDIFRRSKWRSACPFVSSLGVVSPDRRALEAGLVFVDFWSESEAGDEERGVDDRDEETRFGE